MDFVKRRSTSDWLVVGLALACDLVLVVLPAGNGASVAAFMLLWILPGLAWASALGGRLLIGFGLGIAATGLATLLLYYLPGASSRPLAIVVSTLLAVGPAMGARGEQRWRPPAGRQLVPLLLLILLAAAFRFSNLGYSEFQGDEGIIMVRAAAGLLGDDSELFLHQKGPAEVLIPMAGWQLAGTINEFWARLPFAWASLLGVLAVWRLGTRWYNARVGWLAGMLMAISGFHIAFARIVQYQDVVILMALLALLSADRYRLSGRLGDLVIAALLMAFGALAHYDLILFAPAVALVVLPVFWRPGRRPRAGVLAHTALALVAGGLTLALFYLPYALNPNFGKTAAYLAGDRIGGGLHFNAAQAWVMSTVYNSTYYVALLALAVLAALAPLRNSRRLRAPALAMWAMFLVPFVFYLVIVFDPRTHLYTFFPGAILIAAAAAVSIWMRFSGPGTRRAISLAGAGLYLLCAGYPWLVFVSHSPEYQRTFPEHKSWLYWTSYQEIPQFGRFGFPHQAGWRAITDLVMRGEMNGVYASNEEQEVTDWYALQAARTHCSGPDTYIVAERVQDQVPIDEVELESDYGLAGAVMVDGEARLRWYTRDQSAGPIPTLDAAAYRPWWRPNDVVPPSSGGQHPASVNLGDLVRLVGYDLDLRQAAPGGWIDVTLYWQALAPMTQNYQVFVHLYDGQMWGQHDGAPECDFYPTTRWEPGQIIMDPHRVKIEPETPARSIPLYAGMYDLITSDRLWISGSDRDAVLLAEIQIGATSP